MEEVRSFGYLCPKCGKAVLGSRSVFALQAAAVRIGCACGESELEIQTDGTKFRLWVPCGLCGGEHHAEVDAAAILTGRGVGLACPETKQLCCYAGEESQVMARTEELAIRVDKELSEQREAFTDNVKIQEEEIDSYIWVDLQQARKMCSYDNDLRIIEKAETAIHLLRN